MDSKGTGLETYITWADFSSPTGCFVLQDGVSCSIIVEICDEKMALIKSNEPVPKPGTPE